jgi:hypothetical protein
VHLLYCDETNLQERRGDFLIYGGITIESARALDLSHRIDDIRRGAMVDRSFRLKFNPGPPGLPQDDFIALKQEIIQAATEHGVGLLAYLVLHDIAGDPDAARRYGINTICYHFDCILHRRNDAGLVLIDRFTDEGNQIDAHLTEKFSVGVRGMPYSREMRLNRIVGLHYSAIGQSHFPSLIDIILGSLRFAVNRHTRGIEQHENTARALLGLLAPMFDRREDGRVSELSLLFSPKVIKLEQFRARYQGLKDYLAASGIEAEQIITEYRQY